MYTMKEEVCIRTAPRNHNNSHKKQTTTEIEIQRGRGERILNPFTGGCCNGEERRGETELKIIQELPCFKKLKDFLIKFMGDLPFLFVSPFSFWEGF